MSAGLKKLLQTLAAMAVLGGLIAYAYYDIELGEKEKKATEEAEKQPFKGLEPAAVRRVRLWASGKVFVFERESDKAPWRMLEPLKTDADQTKLEGLLKAVKGLEFKSTTKDITNLDGFGLSSPRVKIEVTTNTVAANIEFGDKFEYDGSVFIRLPPAQGEVHTVDEAVYNAFNNDVFDLRMKQVIDFANDDVAGVTVTNGTEPFTLTKGTDGAWTVANRDGQTFAGDKEEIEKLFRALKARVARFAYDQRAADESPQVAPFGLTAPAIRYELNLGAKGKVVFLANEIPSAEADIAGQLRPYAMREGGNTVAEFDAARYKDLLVTPNQLKERTVLRFDREAVGSLELTKPDGYAVTVTRKKTEVKGTETPWELTTPAWGNAYDYKVSSLIYALGTVKSVQIEEKPDMAALGLDTGASGRIVVKDKAGGELGTLIFGKVQQATDGSTVNGRVWVYNPKRGWADQIEQSKYEALFKKPDDLAETPPKNDEPVKAPGAPSAAGSTGG
jgi:hypothetical protein